MDAFTKQEILDQWWAPKPLASKTKVMNFINDDIEKPGRSVDNFIREMIFIKFF